MILNFQVCVMNKNKFLLYENVAESKKAANLTREMCVLIILTNVFGLGKQFSAELKYTLNKICFVKQLL